MIVRLLQFCIFILLVAGFFDARGQFSVTGETVVAVSSGTKLSLDAPVNNHGSIVNSGTLYLRGNWANTGFYTGPGSVHLAGAEQVFNHGKKELATLFVGGGGIKQVTNGVVISEGLVFSEGWLQIEDTAAFLVKNTASIAGASASGYVRGKMQVSGLGRHYYPIGTATTFTPVELLDVKGNQPIIGFEARDTHPESQPGLGLQLVSQARYWQQTVVSGEMVSGRIKLQVINEGAIGSMEKASVAGANELGGVYENLGQHATTGTVENGTITSFEDALFQYYALARELNEGRVADSIALVKLYERANGDNWVNRTNWLSGAIDTWTGVSVQAERVVSVNLAANNLTGRIPSELRNLGEAVSLNFSGNQLSGSVPGSLAQLGKLQTFNLSQNNIRDLPDLSSLPSIQLFDVSSNNLEFDDLEPNVSIPNFVYAEQAAFAAETDSLQPVHQPFLLSLSAGGSANQYQWYRQGVPVAGAESPSLFIEDLIYDNMGAYDLRVTNTIVPGLTLKSASQRIRATAVLQGTVRDASERPVADAVGALLAVKTGKYDTAAHYAADANGNFSMPAVVLGDYLLYASQNPQRYIPTYYKTSTDWAEADVISLRDDVAGIDIAMESMPVELTPDDGDNQVAGTLDEDVPEGRLLARQRVKGAGVSLHRQRARGKGLEDEFVYELLAYIQTDDNGEFSIGNLPDGVYRINIQYPGVPMDSTSFVEFEVGGGASVEENNIVLEALVTESGIVVSKVAETGIYLGYFKDLQVFPNPADKFLTIQYAKLVKGQVVAGLYDLNGKMLQQLSLTDHRNGFHQMEVSALKSGLYLLRFYDALAPARPIISYRIVISR